jgi:hypothetical protein
LADHVTFGSDQFGNISGAFNGAEGIPTVTIIQTLSILFPVVIPHWRRGTDNLALSLENTFFTDWAPATVRKAVAQCHVQGRDVGTRLAAAFTGE